MFGKEEKCFKELLKIGQGAERDFAEILQKQAGDNFIKIEGAPNKLFPDWDLRLYTRKGDKEVITTYEVKYDQMSNDTSNIAIEFRGHGVPSGVFISKADYIVFKAKEEWRIQERGEFILRTIDLLMKGKLTYKKRGINNLSEFWTAKEEDRPYLLNKLDINDQEETEPGEEARESDGEAEPSDSENTEEVSEPLG